jgi:hypothetical protein
MSYDPNKREEWWDLEVGQCRGCGAPVEEEHAPGCPEMQADLVDRAYERGRELRDLAPITSRCIEPLDLRGKSDAEVKVLLGEQ